jgi:hypothetical protein
LDQLFGIAEKIATPLSLAALTVLILYSVFRLIIQGLDLKTVLPAHIFHLLMRAMTYVFVLAICALVLGLLSYLATSELADVIRGRRTDDFLRELGNPTLARRIAAIQALAQIGRSDPENSQRICDSLATLVRHPPLQTIITKARLRSLKTLHGRWSPLATSPRLAPAEKAIYRAAT